MRGVFRVLVFWQLETYTVTMHSPVGNTRQDAENYDICTKTATETAEAPMIRWSRLLHNCQAKHKLLHGDGCGHVARVTNMDPKRATSRIFTLKNMKWLRRLKKELGSQCHGRRFRQWRWEQAVAQCVGTEWVKVAQDRAAWRAKMDAMIK